MNLRQRVRNWLGITDLSHQIAQRGVEIAHLTPYVKAVSDRSIVTNEAIGMILAKVDPLRGTSEDDPKRRAESNKLGEEIIQRLMAEQTQRSLMER